MPANAVPSRNTTHPATSPQNNNLPERGRPSYMYQARYPPPITEKTFDAAVNNGGQAVFPTTALDQFTTQSHRPNEASKKNVVSTYGLFKSPEGISIHLTTATGPLRPRLNCAGTGMGTAPWSSIWPILRKTALSAEIAPAPTILDNRKSRSPLLFTG